MWAGNAGEGGVGTLAGLAISVFGLELVLALLAGEVDRKGQAFIRQGVAFSRGHLEEAGGTVAGRDVAVAGGCVEGQGRVAGLESAGSIRLHLVGH